MSKHFYPLTIADVRRETADCVSIAFDVPLALREIFSYRAGQYVNLRAAVNGERLQRSYSLCSAPQSGEWRVAIKRVADGRFSSYANSVLKVGDAIDVMPPDGKFCFAADDANEVRHMTCVAAGSGITPILSILHTALASSPNLHATLIYGNRRVRDIMFKEDIADLRDRFLARFQVMNVLSQEPSDIADFIGRIDRKKILSIINKNTTIAQTNRAYICGPDSMATDVVAALKESGVTASTIHRELFGVTETQRRTTANSTSRSTPSSAPETAAACAVVEVIADGIARELRVPFVGQSILEASLGASIDAPFACKAGVCCTCRARVLEGEVKMDANYTLEQHEVNRGFVLTCQAHPVSDRVRISYDAR